MDVVDGNRPKGGRQREGNRKGLQMNTNDIITGPELICSDCGARFSGRRVTDGVEEICDACYEARLPARFAEPHSVTRHSHHYHLDHLAAD